MNSFKRKTINKVILQEDTQSIGVLKGGIIGRPQKDKGSYRKRDILGKLQLRDSAGTSFPLAMVYFQVYMCADGDSDCLVNFTTLLYHLLVFVKLSWGSSGAMRCP